MSLTYEEFTKLALAELESVNRMARVIARDSFEADDLVQETYARAIRAWSGFELRSHGIRAWLLRILQNTHLNRVARQGRESQLADGIEIEAQPVMTELSAGTDWSQFDGRLKLAMQQLPESLRVTISLWALEELKYHEIADILQIPIGTVMSRLHRARAILQEKLGAMAKDRGLIRE